MARIEGCIRRLFAFLTGALKATKREIFSGQSVTIQAKREHWGSGRGFA